ncbi:nicotinate (nicotinamide) nucleotide adenylyltransferase [candidate division KSB1 bacterium]|nr:nicotinate (nicotinamide) nucleotide adenylyltransferase [candidate division KSB1 bacterium]NIR72253.1 nicotinate (nicotinamide) nucleotide adenylyltransferase [candidate division KSB1 bacterium]NIS24224.1 nicotinate (nicotinamide) nucleotide adenylyltransferase [candidate division KSB1 bacterium]NIT71138.1 nicotinate (nicotinamide) nucleotide adenylyltransferase [candidate division KSB1 bacterium]NIU24843.1 nicotinate (nicotinamide) nucleotide adenylyltransferase [candidate division KSB1 ba
MKIGLYGGTFDPIHIAHLIIAQYIKEELHLSKVIFIPSGSPPHKEVYSAKALRLKMVQASIQGNPDFDCSEIEIHGSDTNYSVETILRLKKELDISAQSLFWIIGSDNFMDFPKWKEPEKILQMCNVVVFPRESNDFEKAPPEFKHHESVHLLDAPILQISSTEIRTLIQQERSIKYLVPPPVERIIRSNNLYR